MSELTEWQKALVVQKDRKLGAIPAGFEWMIKLNGIEGVDFETFQDSFNLQSKGDVQNTFGSVAEAVEGDYSHIKIKHKDFYNCREKLDLIKDLIDRNVPCMMKFAISSKNNTAHEMPVVIYDENYMRFVWQVVDAKKPDMLRVAYNDIIDRHYEWEEAREVAWLDPIS